MADANMHWKLQAFVTAFGMGKPAREADVEAWMVRGDEAALARVSGRASKKVKDWRTLGLIGMDASDAAMVERGLRLVVAAKSGEDLLAWLAGFAQELWILAYHRWWNEAHGGLEVVAATRRFPHERRQAALLELLRTIAPDEAMLTAAFRGLGHGSGPFFAWDLLGQLGAEERKDGGRSRRSVRRLGCIVGVEEKAKRKLHVLADAAAADAFIASLPAVEETLGHAKGMVALWIGAQLDPKGTLDGKGGPLGWFDHDDWETAAGPPAVGIRQFSYASTFADAAIARAAELGLTGPERIDAIYGRVLSGLPGKKQYGFYLGAFPYQKPYT